MTLTKTNHTLPSEVADTFAGIDIPVRDEYIRTLRSIGWTLQSIASVAGVTRERVRQITAEPSAEGPALTVGFPFPTPPERPSKAPRIEREPSGPTLRRLRELKPLAALVRGNGKRFRAEAEEFTRLLHHANTVEGVSLYHLAQLLGVTQKAISTRLVRYGYRTTTGSAKVHAPIKSENRAR